MEILVTVIILIVLGIACILLEILVFPGITVAGILGVILLIIGIYLSYNKLGFVYGNITLLSALIVGTAATYLAFRSKTWKAVALNKSIDSQFKVFEKTDFLPGETAVTVSRLAPIGNIKIKNKIIEATTRGDFIDEKEEVVIVKVKNNIVVVKKKIINNKI